jgi:hypothetical protein
MRGGLALLAGLSAFALPSVALPATAPPHLATTATGTASLVVTFAEPPADDAAHAALDALGTVAPLVPEAGVWTIAAPADAALRARALAAAGVTGAEWSLVRRPDDIAPPRSNSSRYLAIVQPWPSSPTRASSGTRTSSKNT